MINQTCSLILHDLYGYDIVSAYPTILGKQFYDFKDIDLDNKTERNIFIGTQQRGNQNLSQFLIKSAESLVDFYLLENELNEDEIIATQRDGFIVKKILKNDDQFIDMKLREYIDFLLISPDREKYLYLSDDEIIVKGMPFYYDGLQIFYRLFSKLNFYDKSVLFEQLNQIKNQILFCEDVKPFLIPRDEESFIVITFKGNLEVKDPDFVSITSIDRYKYYQHFFKGFLGSVYLECY
jgi:hypothetical protein